MKHNKKRKGKKLTIKTTLLPKNRVVGYWNIGRKFLMAITDDNVENIIVKLVAKEMPKTPDMKGRLEIPSGEVINVYCINE